MFFAEEYFKFFSVWNAVEMGLYFIIVGYYFLLFAYFLSMRWRISRKLFWFFLSILFLCLAAGRVFFIVYYFFLPELEGQISNIELISLFMMYYRLATFFTWMGIACLMGVLGVLLFPPDSHLEQKSSEKKTEGIKEFLKDNIKYLNYLFRIGLIVSPIIIGILALSLPDNVFMDPDLPVKYNYDIDLILFTFGSWSYPIGRFVLNLVLLPLFMPIIPLIFLYLAFKTFGVLRKSYALNAIGFFLYYAGRISQGLFEAIGWAHVSAIASPLLILLSLLIIVIANNYEQLK